ncbi:hypothetical protein Bca101_057640 [Brassica carinata]
MELAAKVPDLPMVFPAAPVGGHVKPRLFSDDPFSSPVSSWERASGTDDEAAPMAPLKHGHSHLLDDGPRSRVRGEDLVEIRMRYVITSTVGIRNPSEFERAPDGGVNEVAIYEAYLEAGMRNGVPSLVSEVSSYFGFGPSQLTPLSWRTLMAIQVLGELRGFHIGVHEVSPLIFSLFCLSRARTFPNRLVPQTCLVPCPLLGRKWEASDEQSSIVPMGELPGNVVELPISAIFTSYQGVKTRRKRSSRALPPRLTRAAALASSPPRLSSVDAGAEVNRSFPRDAHQKLFAEVLFLRGQVQEMMVHRDQLVQQVRMAARWELMKEWLEERTRC